MKKIKTTCLYFLLFLSQHLIAQPEGGLFRPYVWLKGNFSADPHRQASLNFNPAMALSQGDTDLQLPRNLESLRIVTIFTVYQDSLSDKEKPVWEMNGEFGELSLSTNQVTNKGRETAIHFEKIKPKGNNSKAEALIHSYSCPNISGPVSRENRYKKPFIHFGNAASSGSADSPLELIAEFMLYKRELSEAETGKIETYLALKYGITIHQNYLNSSGKTVWNVERDSRFSNNIAGIARDDRSFLLQKQGTSCSSAEHLTIGVDKIVSSNIENQGQLNDEDYLVWGDNGEKFITPNGIATDNEILLAEKKWLIQPSGKSSTMISTELKVSTAEFLHGKFPEKNFYLVINRSASSDFRPDHCTYLSPDNISNGVATFKNILWDTDGSGKDKFTFGYKPEIIPQPQAASQHVLDSSPVPDPSVLISCQVYPNPVSDGHFQATIQLDKPADIKINIYDLSQQLIFSQEHSGQALSQVSGYIEGAPGAYVFQLITPGAVFYRMIILQ